MWMRVEHFLCNESSVKVRVDLSTPCAAHARACLTFFLSFKNSRGERRQAKEETGAVGAKERAKDGQKCRGASRRGSELGSGQRGWEGRAKSTCCCSRQRTERASERAAATSARGQTCGARPAAVIQPSLPERPTKVWRKKFMMEARSDALVHPSENACLSASSPHRETASTASALKGQTYD